MVKKYSILFCVLSFSFMAYGQKANINLDTLINICLAYENAIDDVNLQYNLEIVPESTSVGSLKYSGPQNFCFISAKPFSQKFKFFQTVSLEDEKNDKSQLNVIRSYNSGIFKELQKTNDGKYLGMTNNSNSYYSIKPISLMDFTLFTGVLNFQPLLEVLKGRYDYYTLVLDPNVSKVNDFNAVEIVCFSNKQKEKMNRVLGLYFSIDHNFTLVKMIAYGTSNNISASSNILKLKDVGNGIWFPEKANITNNQGVVVNILSANQIMINQKINVNYFDIKFPPGTKVQDEIAGKYYTVKPTQEQVDESLPK